MGRDCNQGTKGHGCVITSIDRGRAIVDSEGTGTCRWINTRSQMVIAYIYRFQDTIEISRNPHSYRRQRLRPLYASNASSDRLHLCYTLLSGRSSHLIYYAIINYI